MKVLKSTQKWFVIALALAIFTACGKDEEKEGDAGNNPASNTNTLSISGGGGSGSNVGLNVSCQNIPNVAKDYLGITAYDDAYDYSIDIVMHPTPTASGTYEVVKWDPQWGTSVPIDSNQAVIGLGGDKVTGYGRSSAGQSMQITVGSDGSVEVSFDKIVTVDYTGNQNQSEISGTIKCD